MKAVVDTNVIAHLLLGTEAFVDEARTCFEAVSNPVAPAHWEAELTNVVWMAIRTGVLPAEEGPVRLGLARRLGIESVATATLCQGALLRAVTAGVPVYETRCSSNWPSCTGCPLVTFDKAMLRAFPDLARRPRDL